MLNSRALADARETIGKVLGNDVEEMPVIDMADPLYQQLINIPLDVVRPIMEKACPRNILAMCYQSPEILEHIKGFKLKSGGYKIDFTNSRVRMLKRNFRWKLREAENKGIEETMACFEFLASVFPGKPLSLRISPSALNIFHELFPKLQDVECLEYSWDVEDIPRFQLPESEMLVNMLEKLPNVKEIIASDGDWDTPAVYTVDHFTLRNNLMDWYDIREIKNKSVLLVMHQYRDVDLNTFFQQWQYGEYKELEMLTITIDNYWRQEKVLDGLDAKHWPSNKEAKRPRNYIPPGVKPFLICHPMPRYCKYQSLAEGLVLENAWDIEREDGTVGSILFDRCQIVFIVWHNPRASMEFMPQIKEELADAEKKFKELLAAGVGYDGTNRTMQNLDEVIYTNKLLVDQYSF